MIRLTLYGFPETPFSNHFKTITLKVLNQIIMAMESLNIIIITMQMKKGDRFGSNPLLRINRNSANAECYKL